MIEAINGAKDKRIRIVRELGVAVGDLFKASEEKTAISSFVKTLQDKRPGKAVLERMHEARKIFSFRFS